MSEIQANLSIEDIANANERAIQNGDTVTVVYDEMNIKIKGKAANVKPNRSFDFVLKSQEVDR